jgi:hypothetical protein
METEGSLPCSQEAVTRKMLIQTSLNTVVYKAYIAHFFLNLFAIAWRRNLAELISNSNCTVGLMVLRFSEL